MGSKNQSDFINELYYKGERFYPKIPIGFVQENLEKILSKENMDKYFNSKDFEKFSKFLPECTINNKNSEEIKNQILEILNPESKLTKFNHPVELFKNMLDKNYFSQKYQNNIERLKVEALEDYIDKYEHRLNQLSKYSDKYSKIFSKFNDDITGYIDGRSDELEEEDKFNIYSGNFQDDNIKFDENTGNTYLASSGYSTFSSDDEQEDLMQLDVGQRNSNEPEESVTKDQENLEGGLSDERFKNLKMNKNQLTIRSRSPEEIKEFQRQEEERYKNPHLPWNYSNADGSTSVVAPVVKKIPTGVPSKPRDHVMLKSDRPSYVTILCLARDAASRLPEGVGTRADICDLLKDSQYINERLSDSQVKNNILFLVK
jgi:hypothetical protein